MFLLSTSRGTDELLTRAAEATGALVAREVGRRTATYVAVQMENIGFPPIFRRPAVYAAQKIGEHVGKKIGGKIAGSITRKKE